MQHLIACRPDMFPFFDYDVNHKVNPLALSSKHILDADKIYSCFVSMFYSTLLLPYDRVRGSVILPQHVV